MAPGLESLASQLAVSLQNGLLEDSLVQVTALKDRLEELVKAKDQFIATVSHELRTPLTGIVGLTEELKTNGWMFTPEEAAELLEIVNDQSKELSHIVEDLLVAARADIGTLALRPEEIDLTTTIAGVASTLNLGPTLEIKIRGVSPTAWADPMRVRQVIRNLLTNAARYGGETCWAEAATTRTGTKISVYDDGPGVPQGMEDEIFEPYIRAYNVDSMPGSAGLGLAVSRKLARAMGGDLIYRRMGDTTVFDLTLPAVSKQSWVSA